MNALHYGNETIDKKEIVYVVPSMLIGVGILSLPRIIAGSTLSSDGWISITIGGLISVFFIWIAAKLAARFPQQSFLEYVSAIATKPVAYIISTFMGIHLLVFTAFVSRAIGSIAKQYLFYRTPLEFITLAFLLVVIYGVSGSRAALLRINLMFLPIILFVIILVQIMNLGYMEIDNLTPVFSTKWVSTFTASKEIIFTFIGFEILLFYIAFMNQPNEAPKAAVMGGLLTILVYLIVYLSTIAVFGNTATANIMFPTIENAKEIQVPGEFFERFESIFLTIWTMTIFNTAAMAFDVAILAIQPLCKKCKKMTLIFIASPIVYLIAMTPKSFKETAMIGQIFGYSGILFALVIPAVLLFIAKVRGLKGKNV